MIKLESSIVPPSPGEATYTQLYTLEMFQRGIKPADIAEQRNVRLSTIMTHLSDLIEMGYPVDLDRMVPPSRREKILVAIQTVEDLTLSNIREQLGETYGWDEIRLVRAWWKHQIESGR